jgi:aminoglycoside phosphotransferase family enzyme/predicted kinase
MAIPSEQGAVVAFLRKLSGAEPTETHISVVFVGSGAVWKLRKAVRLDYLDFTSPAARRHFAMRELELNARAAPGLYRDVVPILDCGDGSLALGDGEGSGSSIIDWVVRMAPVSADDFLEPIARSGGLTPQLLDAMADAVAEYHFALPPRRDTRPADAMRLVAAGNADSAISAGLPPPAVRAWLEAASGVLEALSSWLNARGRDGFVRRGHGDLHLGNMCLWHGRPVPFDALEFDEEMATTDLGYDLAFLLMDIDHRVGRDRASRVLNRYVARTGDAGLTTGLPLFMSMRALVRSHVEAARGRPEFADSYLRAANVYLRSPPGLLVAIGGLPGMGKSTLARALAPALGRAPGALVLRSDEIRKRQHGVAPEQRLPPAAYGEPANEATMRTLVSSAEAAAMGGHAVIADATFLEPHDRAAIAAAARRAGVPFLGLWLEAPLAALEARIDARKSDASDATAAVLRAAAAAHSGGAPEDPGWRPISAVSAEAACGAAVQMLRAVLAKRD